MSLSPKQNMFFTLKDMKVDFVQEFYFHPKRKWRFDFAIPEKRIALEYEGLMSTKSRHTTISGFSGDAEKYNEAVILGWRVLRYTALNYQNMRNDLEQLLKQPIG